MTCFIVAAKRTPFGSFGGSLKDLSATDLAVTASKAALSQLPKNTPIDSVIFGNVLQTSHHAAYLARHVGLYSGLPVAVPALTINRLCGSGFQSIVSAIHEIQCNDAHIVLSGGTESMSQAPYALRNSRWGTKYGVDLNLEDTLASSLIDRLPEPMPMAITAENLAAHYSITREQCDEYALKSQTRAEQGNFYFIKPNKNKE
jgi:acetyl-CoA acyltransferase 2